MRIGEIELYIELADQQIYKQTQRKGAKKGEEWQESGSHSGIEKLELKEMESDYCRRREEWCFKGHTRL